MKHNSYLKAKWLESYYEVFVYRVAGDNLLWFYSTYPHPTRSMIKEALLLKEKE